MLFSDIPGLTTLKETIRSSFQRNHIAHAQLFYGKEGGAAFPLALAYATFLLCENKQEEDACGTCSNCQKMHKHIHPDVHYFYPSSKTDKESDLAKQAQQWRTFLMENHYGNLEDWINILGSENKQNQISKEDARQIIRTVGMKSFEGGYKILFIWYPELMHPSAANAILKVLEEPPPNTLYFLITYDYEALLSTILSRTQLVVIPSFGQEEIISCLTEKHGVPMEKARKRAQFAAGSMGRALSESEQSEDLVFEDFQEWMRACFKPDFTALTAMSEKFSQLSKARQRGFVTYAIELVRQSLLVQAGAGLTMSEGSELAFVSKFSQTLPFEILEKVYQQLNLAILHLQRNANARITHLALSIRISLLMRQG